MKAKDLVSACRRKAIGSWYDALNGDDRKLINEVAEEVAMNAPRTPVRTLAKSIREHFDLSVTVETISRLLSERIRDAKEKIASSRSC